MAIADVTFTAVLIAMRIACAGWSPRDDLISGQAQVAYAATMDSRMDKQVDNLETTTVARIAKPPSQL